MRSDPVRKPSPRRAPKRKSGEQIVQAILEAAAELLSEKGYAHTSTNAIADRAGVSIGSLYHYFSSKEALLMALSSQLEQHTLVQFQESLAACTEHTVQSCGQAVVKMLNGRQLGDLQLRRELLRFTPRDWTSEVAGNVDSQVAENLEALLAALPDARNGNRALMAFIILYAIEGIFEAIVLHQGNLLGSSALEEELVRLITGYLQP